ncbi:hypothetical protein HRG_001301 [Hirsutella rhossiliensis]|uniref:Mitochondrial substrate carrier n=1 Tax=Hirsutella rhossiliensis TaxID=111463 RepID=A0A9P8SNQ9_9HYPO|nr:Mitochondrial substrate carrier [Hirsutella rhossiliensis]KAH0968659.1 Mitochondrial substrate carrier [Hirsutella rhossiliensis]
MDPFSITAGTAGLTDVTFRVINYLIVLRGASKKIQGEVDKLANEVKALANVNELVEELPFRRQDWDTLSPPADHGATLELQERLASTLLLSKGAVKELEALLIEVVGNKDAVIAGKFDGLKATIKFQNRQDDYSRLCHRIHNYQDSIQVLLLSLNIMYIRQSLPPRDLAVGNFPEELRRQITRLRIKMSNFRQDPGTLAGAGDATYSIDSVSAVASLIRFNEHFDIPQNVSSYYTGRQRHLNELRSIVGIGELHQHQTHQKRFVISGLGGSGKTQFCCKFAQDNREHFWGVFWVDGSSGDNAQRCYSEIAKVGGVEPNENAAKNWLSGLQLPWLLLIDNADDPEIDVARYFPGGEGGVILITTRNPSTRSDLLLAAAVLPRPWEVPTRSHADRIARVLGYLPLALIHAGKTVLDKLCSLSDYPEYYERTWNKIRRSRSRRASHGHDDEHVSSMSVYSSYEMIYVGLENKTDRRSRDALELLKMFSFFYRENIEFDLIKTAATNPRRERGDAQATEHTEEQHLAPRRPHTWMDKFYSWAIGITEQLRRERIALPHVLRDEDDTPFDEDRLRIALSLLVRLGMKQIKKRLQDNQRAREYVKFSLVYLSCGDWAKAEELQLQVKDYLFATLGPESKYGIDIALLLSTTYVLQTRTNEARVLQYQEVIEKLSKLEAFGPEHENFYTAIDNLAKVRLRYFDMEEAVRLQELAYKGMKRILGPTHRKTLEAQDDLAGIYGSTTLKRSFEKACPPPRETWVRLTLEPLQLELGMGIFTGAKGNIRKRRTYGKMSSKSTIMSNRNVRMGSTWIGSKQCGSSSTVMGTKAESMMH